MIELSVVITGPSGARSADACLRALGADLLDARAVEILVVADRAPATVPGLPAVRVIAPPRGAGAAQQAGAVHAAGRLVLFLAAEHVPAPGLPAAHIRAQRAAGQGLVAQGSIVLRGRRRDGLARHLAATARSRDARLAAAEGTAWWPALAASNLSVPRAALLDCGGFAGAACARDLGRRLAGAGLSFAHVASAVAVAPVPSPRGAVACAVLAGRGDAGLLCRDPATLPQLPLAAPPQGTLRARVAHRLLTVSGASLRLVAPLARARPELLLGAAYWRGVRQSVPDRDTWRRLRRGTVILMYHALGAGEPASRFVVPARRFARQMAWLRWSGWTVLGLERYLELRERHELPPARSVVVTFDDGYADLALARPVLARRRMTATVFVVSDRVGERVTWALDRAEAAPLARRPLLGWPELRLLAGDGVELGAHSRTHPRLTAVPPEDLDKEISGSRAALEAGLERPVRTFAYPYGDHDARVRAGVARSGLRAAVGVTTGLNHAATSLRDLRRLEVRGTDSLLAFAFTLWAGDRRVADRLGRRS